MADDGVSNGVEDQHEESVTKISALERVRDELLSENAEKKEQINKLTAELEELRSNGAEMREKIEEMQAEVERLQGSAKAAEVIAARAADLETQVARLQHDMITDMSSVDEMKKEADELKVVLKEKESRVENLVREVEELKKVKLESEARLRDLEKKIGVLEMKEIEERNKRIRVEEELRDKIGEKDREIEGFRLKVEGFEKVAADKKDESGEWYKEKLSLEKALKESEEKAKAFELNIIQLREEAGEAEKIIRSLNEKAVEIVDRDLNGIHGEEDDCKLQWPIIAAGAGSTVAVVAAAALIYVYCGKRR
ncbi:peroxisomal and mitochondrial division factor 2-like [Cicer arietinum]|uniref:Peroxisomal and mitochondrial division factor 2-like n=1 Tax=Cicer arietinum TaxID=3827 RepID=A0A1S2XP62_CICAR|nr:peroxisomal and mitochondrial division factor 2-like [Cicer arietinum]